MAFLAVKGGEQGVELQEYPIDSTAVVKTTQRMISFPYTPPPAGAEQPLLSPNGIGSALTWDDLSKVSEYAKLGYGQFKYVDQPLKIDNRLDIMPQYYDVDSDGKRAWLNFAAISDIHITDKEAPNQLLYLQKGNHQYAGQNTSLYSGVLPYTTQVFDATIQTINALNKKDNFDFMISLGDVTNSTRYNELRWYLDIIDGKSDNTKLRRSHWCGQC